ncbi:MAG: LapA family protein [Magnetococcales bacterium]|nr:LapA family protein [Magnetococcales bacterium]
MARAAFFQGEGGTDDEPIGSEHAERIMQGWIRLITATVLGIVAMFFAMGNQTEVVVTLPGLGDLVEVPLFVLVFVPLFLGFVLGAVSGWSGGTRPRGTLDLLRDQNQALERELTNLRNLPLTNDL